jgi:hypothetical protein
MDERYIRDHDLIDRYLLHRLSEEERFAFEQYYFEHPEMLEELELTRALRDTLRSSGELLAPSQRPPWAQRFLDLVARPAWSLAATAAAAMLALVLVAQPDRPGAWAPLPVVADLELTRTRAAPGGQPPAISLAGEGVVSLTIEATGLDSATLAGTIRGPGTSVDLPIAPPRESGFATIVLPTRGLPPGDYSLALSDGSGNRLSYEFRITRP